MTLEVDPSIRTEVEFIERLAKTADALTEALDAYVDEYDEWFPMTAMYDLARAVVQMAEHIDRTGDKLVREQLLCVYACLEEAMSEEESSPLPDLIRHSMCDMLGRQSVHPTIFAVLLQPMGSRLKKWLVLADDRMPFRHGEETFDVTDVLTTTVSNAARTPKPVHSTTSSVLEHVMGEPWNYSLYRSGPRMFLSVLSGGAGISGRDVRLTSDEMEDYRRRGRDALIELAASIRERPTDYDDRHIKGFCDWNVLPRQEP